MEDKSLTQLRAMSAQELRQARSFRAIADGEFVCLVIVPPFPWVKEDIERIVADAESLRR